MTGPPRAETAVLSDLLLRVQTALSDRYRVERAIGQGGMGTVFAAEDLKHHRRVAIKVLRPELAGALGPERFLREIEIAASLNHPHIVSLHDSGTAGGLLYYVMPLVDGESVRDRLAREVQMSVPDAVAIACEVADALGFAHGLGIVHRDIKPENILLESGHAVVADFGVARAISEIAGRSLTEPGLAVGTPAYMSPEQAGGGRVLDGRSDQYALACVLYEMLAGVPPFTGPTPQAIVARQLADTPPALHIVRVGIPPALENAITRGLAKVPADRFPSVQAFGSAVSTALREPAPPAGRYGERILALAVVLVLGLGTITLRGSLARRSPPAPQSAGHPALPTSIAVLYFDDRSQNGGLEHLATGLTEDLIDRLAGVKALRVISPDGVRPLQGKAIAPDSISRLFSVGTLVTGSVERIADRLRVSVRLIDAFTGVQLSSESLEEPLSDLLALRDRLSEEVAQQLRRRLGEAVQLVERRKAASVPEAWDLVLRAEEIRNQTERLPLGDSLIARGLFREADTLLARAQRLDTAWVEPTTLRGWLAYDQAGWGFGAVDSGGVPRGRVATAWITTGMRHANKALSVAPRDPGALELRGTLRYRGWGMSTFAGGRDTTGELALAETDLRAAAETRGRARPRALSTLSSVLQFAGKLDDANLAARQAYAADAFLTDANGIVLRLFDTSLELGRFTDAAEWCDRGVQTFPDNWRFRMCRLRLLAWSPEIRPDVPTAWHLLSELDSLAHPDERTWLLPQMRLVVAAVIAAAGLRDSAERVIAGVGGRASGDPDLLYYEAVARARLGQTRAVARLLQVLLQRIPNYEASLRSDLEFREVWRDSTTAGSLLPRPSSQGGGTGPVGPAEPPGARGPSRAAGNTPGTGGPHSGRQASMSA